MPKGTSSYHSWLVEKLKVPRVAERYLRTALDDSQEAFLTALRNVAEARGMSRLAEETGLNRESLYRTLSSDGNPTLHTLNAIFDALDLKMGVAEKRPETPSTPVPTTPVPAQMEAATSIQVFTGTANKTELVGAWTATNVFMNFANSGISVSMTGVAEPKGEHIPDVPIYMLLNQVSQRQEAGQD